MSQIDVCQTTSTCFSGFSDAQWEILLFQMVQNYGPNILDENFNYQDVPRNRLYWVEQFRYEHFHKQKNNLLGNHKSGGGSLNGAEPGEALLDYIHRRFQEMGVITSQCENKLKFSLRGEA